MKPPFFHFRGLRCVRRVFPRRGERGFTLIELLVVTAIIAVLATITLGVASGARERAAVDRARSELAVLATAIEDYRRIHQAYPPDTDAAALAQALAGKLTPAGAPDTHRPFVDFAALTFNDAGDAIVDPWGRPYVYERFSGGARAAFGLRSSGPDPDAIVTADDIAFDH